MNLRNAWSDGVYNGLQGGGMEHDVWKRWCYTSFSRAVERLWVVVA